MIVEWGRELLKDLDWASEARFRSEEDAGIGQHEQIAVREPDQAEHRTYQRKGDGAPWPHATPCPAGCVQCPADKEAGDPSEYADHESEWRTRLGSHEPHAGGRSYELIDADERPPI